MGFLDGWSLGIIGVHKDLMGKWKEGDDKEKYIAYFEFHDGYIGMFGKNTFDLRSEPKEATEEWTKAKQIIEAKMPKAFEIAKEHRERKVGMPVYDKSIEELNKELIPALNKELEGFVAEVYFYQEMRSGHNSSQYVPHLIIRIKTE